jgi:hypothetical protein
MKLNKALWQMAEVLRTQGLSVGSEYWSGGERTPPGLNADI